MSVRRERKFRQREKWKKEKEKTKNNKWEKGEFVLHG